ncbi:MAG: AIR synthase-related protein [Patescibacteria group bacterium]|nr:AIR synthase-related protein [Patescibacteria group bacterium]
MTQEKGMTYAGTGVDYDAMDPYKRRAQISGFETAQNLEDFGFSEVKESRGESAYVIETPWGYWAFVVEGLGTKSLVADRYDVISDIKSKTGQTHYANIAICNVAMAVNDLITVGALPVVYGQYLAVGESEWFEHSRRCQDLIVGTKRAVDQAGGVWGGGETPTLKDIIVPGAADLAGACFGFIADKRNLIDQRNIQHGDAIILVSSSGIHANGLTMARKIADKLPQGYLTELSDDRTYGESLLSPTLIYAPIINACQKAKVDIHYAVNITGHGWRKLMRAVKPFKYVVEVLPPQLPIFDFIQEHGPVDDREAYANFNMGAGFALYVPETDVTKTLETIAKCGFDALEAGCIEESDKKQVIIAPKDIVFDGETLGVR